MDARSARTRRPAGSLRRINRGRLLELLRRDGPTSRVALARATGLSFAAISAITSTLISERLLCEGWSEGGLTAATPEVGPRGEANADEATRPADRLPGLPDALRDAGRRRGRPAVELSLNPDYGRVVALSLRMSLIETVIADFRGAALAQSRRIVSTRALDSTGLCRHVIDAVGAILDDTAARDRLLGIGVAVQGIVNAEHGPQLWSPALSITDVDLAEPLRRAFGLPVIMANDAIAVALAVAAREPVLARGLMATIMVGHGVGMGVLRDGESTLGDGGVGSEIGHVKLAPDGPQCRCGQRGCIEAYLADYAIYRDARTFADLPPADAQQPSESQMALLRERTLNGDRRLELLFRQAGRALADAVATTVSVLHPDHVVLAGPGMQAFAIMRAAYEERLAEAVLPWLLSRTAIHIRPSVTAMIVDGMVRRTLREVDRRLIDVAPPRQAAGIVAPLRAQWH